MGDAARRALQTEHPQAGTAIRLARKADEDAYTINHRAAV